MKRILFSFFLIVFAVELQAQVNDKAQRREWNDAFMQVDTLAVDSTTEYTNEMSLPWYEPTLSLGGYGLDGMGMYGGLYTPTWRLHEGFNAQLGLSLSVGLGKHAPKGVGFGQNAAFAYLLPVTKRLSMIAGIFAENMDWGTWKRTQVGVAGALAYQLTDRINVYAFGSHTFLPREKDFLKRCDPFSVFWNQPRNRIGAAAEFKIGNCATIGVSVEHNSY